MHILASQNSPPIRVQTTNQQARQACSNAKQPNAGIKESSTQRYNWHRQRNHRAIHWHGRGRSNRNVKERHNQRLQGHNWCSTLNTHQTQNVPTTAKQEPLWGWHLSTYLGHPHAKFYGRGQSRSTLWLRWKMIIIYSQTGFLHLVWMHVGYCTHLPFICISITPTLVLLLTRSNN